MTAVPLLCLVAVGAYLVGAIPFGYLVARAKGVNIFRQGSGNIGATNVGRVLGVRWGLLVFLFDFAKGAGPVLAAGLLPGPTDRDLPADTLRCLAGVCAFLGHLFPVYLGFRGGKGVATGAGVITVLVPWLTLLVLVAWGITLAVTRYVSLASLTAAVLLFVLRLVLNSDPWGDDNRVVTLFCAFAAALVLVRHQGNIRRLLAGTEHRLGSSA
jgi:acyl-phosphate glycerol 3-phosphate acyltransferase